MKQKLLMLTLAAAIVGCSGKQETASIRDPKPAQPPQPQVQTSVEKMPPGHPPIATEPPATAPSATRGAPSGTVTGKVAETMNAGGYTYVRLRTTSGEQWAAIPQASVKKGSTVTLAVQMVADGFESKTLGRKFDKLLFATLVEGSPSQQPVKSAMTSAMGTPAQHMSGGVADSADIKVGKPEGGKTVAEAWAQKAELSEKPVILRGKVVKFLGGIMGKNWLHVRDGSGSRQAGDDDITVTTDDSAKVGDIVTVRGTLRVGRDFGAGYRYPVIIEDAKLQK